jgi:pyruvate dehydrogenase (quinone)/pyruvate oxidase
LQQAFASGKPAIVEVIVDPFEPPMPPNVTLKQATKFAEALIKGEPNGHKIALTLFPNKLNELI